MAHVATSLVRAVTMDTVVGKYVHLARAKTPVIHSQGSVLAATPAELVPGMKRRAHTYLYVHTASLAILWGQWTSMQHGEVNLGLWHWKPIEEVMMLTNELWCLCSWLLKLQMRQSVSCGNVWRRLPLSVQPLLSWALWRCDRKLHLSAWLPGREVRVSWIYVFISTLIWYTTTLH